MDLLDRALALAACALFDEVAPAALVRLAERATAISIAAGSRRGADDAVWVVVAGSCDVSGPGDEPASSATVGAAIGALRIVRADAGASVLASTAGCQLLAIELDDLRDLLEEDTAALRAIVGRLARLAGTATEATART